MLLPVRKVRRGDIVVFKYPEDPTRDFIKRCMGLPGDTLRCSTRTSTSTAGWSHDSSFTYYADSRELPARSLYFHPNRVRDNFGPKTCRPASYFCMGDNRDNSNDSRFWGPVPESYVKGRAFMVYWSFDERARSPSNGPGYGGKLRQIGRVALHFFTRRDGIEPFASCDKTTANESFKEGSHAAEIRTGRGQSWGVSSGCSPWASRS